MNSTLRIFDVPKELLDRLEPTEKQVERFINEEANEVTTEVTTEALERLQMLQEEGLRCRTCQTTFVSREEQRAHYSTDWHRYNLKVKPPIRLEEFEQLLSGTYTHTLRALFLMYLDRVNREYFGIRGRGRGRRGQGTG